MRDRTDKNGRLVGVGGEETATKSRILCAAIHYNDGKERVHQPKNIKRRIIMTK